jgi:hypothetical protein
MMNFGKAVNELNVLLRKKTVVDFR